MKSSIIAVVAGLSPYAAAHSIFQQLWVDSVDYASQCARLPQSNSPVTDVTSTNIRCNVNSGPVAAKCPVKAGSTVTVEMHPQPGDRTCTGASPAIGGAHYGPVIVYMSKVTDSSTADGSAGWFKIFQDTWGHNPSGTSGDSDYWGTNDLNTCSCKMNVKIPSDIAAGDYLLRAEAIALHTASSANNAQFYMTCYQITVSGTGTATPATVSFPGAYKSTDAGILINIHTALSTYVAPGPAVYAGGSTKVAGSACVGCELTCKAGTSPSGTASSVALPSATAGAGAGSGPVGCTVAKYAQCGGNGFTGCTTCASGSTCTANGAYYSQCT